jgi:hypothetical protein
MPNTGTIITASMAPSEFDIADATGRLHAEHMLRLLENVPAERVAALIEGGRIRLGRFLSDNLPAGAPGSAILDAAFAAFDDALKTTKKE